MDGENGLKVDIKSAFQHGVEEGRKKNAVRDAEVRAKKEAAAAARKAANEKFFGGIKAKWESARALVSGAPEIAQGVGKASMESLERTGKAVDDAANRFGNRVEAGVKRFEGWVDVTQKSVDKSIEAGQQKANKWGAENIVKPVVDRLQQAYALPAKLTELRAKMQDAKASSLQNKSRQVESDALDKMNALYQQIEAIKNGKDATTNALWESAREAVSKADALRQKSTERRTEAKQLFPRIRAAIDAFKS